MRLSTFLLSIFIFTLYGCTNTNPEIKHKYIDFTKTEIKLPEDMLLVKNGEIHKFIPGKLKHLVVYHDSTDCAVCELHHVGAYFLSERRS